MKISLAAIFALLLAIVAYSSQPLNNKRLNESPSSIDFETLDSITNYLEWSKPELAPQRLTIKIANKPTLRIDMFGNLIIGNRDTLAQSCELLDVVHEMLDNKITMRNSTIDSAYYYQEQVEFYRQWFKGNDTPNPLTPKEQFKNN